MPNLLPTVQDVVSLAIGHERFLLKNTGLTNDASVDHYVFNPQNVLSNNRHLKSISQMEGQPNGDATTEGQSLQILGYIYMYRGTKEKYWLDRAVEMFDAYVTHFYQGQPIPSDPENSRWLCNWIINGKEPMLANWPIDFANPTHSGFLGSPMTWTAGRTRIPAGAPHWGEYLDKATFAFDGALAWNTIVADVCAILPDGSTDWDNDGVKWDVDWVVDYLGRKVDWDGNILEAVSALPKGTVQLKDTTVAGVHKLCYANCQPVEHGGYLIGRNEAWHNRPLRVPITEQGNLGNAADAELWFCDAAYQLWDITKEQRYHDAWRASMKMCYDYSNIDASDKFFRQSMYDRSPWTDGISYDYGYPSSRVVAYSRDAQGYIVANVDRSAQHTMEQQSVSYKIDDAASLLINVGGLDVNGNPLTVKVTLDLADSKTSDETVGWQINLQDTPADGSVASYTIPLTSLSLADNPNGEYIIADNRVMSDWGSVTHTFQFEDNVYDTRSAQTCTSTVTSDDDGVIIGFWLTDAEEVIPTELVYRTDDKHEWTVGVTDADNWRWHWTLPPSLIWDHVVLDPKDLRLNSYQADEAGRTRPLNPRLTAVDQINIGVVDMLGDATAAFSWYCVNDIPPTFAGHTAWTDTFSITVKGEAAFTMRLGDCSMINPNYNALAYTPGVIPFSNNATEGIVEFDGWRGLPYPGYQHPFIYVHEDEDERLNNMIDFMYDSQQAYKDKFGVVGPGAAAYVWNRWDNIKYGDADTFTFYHWGDGAAWAGYQPRAFASAARAWHEMILTGKTVPTKLILYVENWVNWLVNYVVQYDSFPTDFPSEELPTPIANDFTGHMTGLWLCGLSFAALCGSPISKLDWLIEKAAKELVDNYYIGNVSVMNGSWSPAIRTGDDATAKNNSMFFGFWSGEILRGLGVYLMYRRGVPGEEMDILERTLSNLTQVGSGGVIRPDVTLKEDLVAVETTANTAKSTADGTAVMLETRVPEGRTINNKPMDSDIVFSPEDLGTYDRATIDAKIAAIVAGGYNPVRVNGFLLDRDIILTPGDLGTYTATQIDSLVSNRVPTSRTINGKALTANIDLTADDVDAVGQAALDAAIGGLVPESRTVNGKPLSDDITLTAADVSALGLSALDAVVQTTRTINGYPLSNNIILNAEDVGALGQATIDDAVAGLVPATRTVNGKPLSTDITIDVSDLDVSSLVPRTFTINGTPMTGSSITIDSGSGGYSKSEIDSMLQDYLLQDNGSGIAKNPQILTDGSLLTDAVGSGFFRYQPGLDELSQPTAVSDAPVGSVSGDVLVVSRVDTTDPENTVYAASMLAVPDDLEGMYYRKNGGSWMKIGGGGSPAPFPNVWAPLNDSPTLLAGEAPYDTITVSSQTLDLNSKSLAFSRASTGSYIGKDGVLKTAAIDEPRFELEGLLIEGPGTNNVPSSTTAGATTWKPVATTAAAIAMTNPAGLTDGVTKLESTAATTQFSSAITVPYTVLTVGGYCAFSVFAKAGTHNLVQLRWAGGANGVTDRFVNFDLTTGQYGSNTTVSYARAIPMAGGWFRLLAVTPVEGTLTNGTSVEPGVELISSLSDDRRPSITLAAGKNVYLYGPQLEAISAVSSYIPTSGVVATRAADMVSLDASMNWGNGPVTVMTEVNTNWAYPPTVYPRIFDMTGPAATGYTSLMLSAGTELYGQRGLGTQAITTIAAPKRFVAGLRVDAAGGMDIVMNGKIAPKVSLPYAADTAPVTLRIGGQTTSGARHLYGHLRNFRVWRYALSNDQIQETL